MRPDCQYPHCQHPHADHAADPAGRCKIEGCRCLAYCPIWQLVRYEDYNIDGLEVRNLATGEGFVVTGSRP